MTKKTRKLPENYMDLVFIPKPELVWKTRDDGMVVLDMVHRGFFHGIASKFFHKPKVSHIALDAHGTALWSALDGTNTVYAIVEHMKQSFPAEEDRMLDRTVTFLHTLQVNHFIIQK